MVLCIKSFELGAVPLSTMADVLTCVMSSLTVKLTCVIFTLRCVSVIAVTFVVFSRFNVVLSCVEFSVVESGELVVFGCVALAVAFVTF